VTIGEAAFALMVVYTLGVLVYVLGAALFITKARYIDLKKRYFELLSSPLPNSSKPKMSSPTAPNSPIKLGTSGLSGKKILNNSAINSPPSMEIVKATRRLITMLPMSPIVRRFLK